MKSITTYLHFDGNCRQAMQFYQGCLGGELQLNTYPDVSGKPTTDVGARIIHGQLLRDGIPMLMASDSTPEGAVKPGNTSSVSIECDSIDEIERLFSVIGHNGKVRLPLGDLPWGARFGMLTDQFGVQWMFNCTRS